MTPIFYEQFHIVCNHWYRCLNYNDSRVNRKIFSWALSKGNGRCRNWPYNVKEHLRKIDLDMYTQVPFVRKQCLTDVTDKMMNMHVNNWKSDLNRVASVNGTGCNKLRTYSLFKENC